jgi:rubrerythrin
MQEIENDSATQEDPEEKPSVWRCRECGFIHYGSLPPEFCPVCGQPGTMFDPIKSRRKKYL